MWSRRRIGSGYSPDQRRINIAADLARGRCFVRNAGNETVCKYQKNVAAKIRAADAVTNRKATFKSGVNLRNGD
jgi:hypothetical protein